MEYPFAINVVKYKSISGQCFLPMSSKPMVVVGRNNSGKSNVLRAVASIFNRQYAFGDPEYCFDFSLNSEAAMEMIPQYQNLSRLFSRKPFDLKVRHTKDNILPIDVPETINRYVLTGDFLSDFGRRSSDSNENVGMLYRRVFQAIETSLNGSVYVPNVRYITAIRSEPQGFVPSIIAGSSLTFGGIVADLISLSNPTTAERVIAREKFKKIQDFLAFCLDVKSVRIEVPHDTSTIHVDVDGQEHPLHDLGTGIEQLLIIGMASFGFPGKMVLIDEPELHFHVGTQRRIIQYLSQNIASGFVFATHSPAILDAVDCDVIQVSHDGRNSRVRTLVAKAERYDAVRDLGHSPSELLLTRFAIWVEGPSDRIYLKWWLSHTDLIEGIDYTILFYGGKVLSHHSFDEEQTEFVSALSLCRKFAVIVDSDLRGEDQHINATKSRIRDETEKAGGMFWVTEGREIENYVPATVLQSLAQKWDWVKVPASKYEQVLDPNKAKKTDFARAVVETGQLAWTLDLEERIGQLVAAIRAAK